MIRSMIRSMIHSILPLLTGGAACSACCGPNQNSASIDGPGRPNITHHGPTSVGFAGGGRPPAVDTVLGLLRGAGYDARFESDIEAKVWSKAVLNASINPLCAATGLRSEGRARPAALAATCCCCCCSSKAAGGSGSR